jgi:hypothetical protein
MALEPVTVTAAEPENHELADMSRRLWIAGILTVPILVSAMTGWLPLSGRARPFLEGALATPVCLWAAWPFYLRAIASIRHRSLNMFTLIGLGVGVAYGYSVSAAALRLGRRACLLRGCRRHRHAHSAWASARVARPQPDGLGDPGALEAGSSNGSSCARVRSRPGGAARPDLRW